RAALCWATTVVFVAMRRPPTPTLFPYTTLFRSQVQQGALARPPDCTGSERRRTRRPLLAGELLALHEVEQRHQQARHRRVGGDIDRKSTRLNSSHVKISYAVFCLKKKNRRPLST